MEVFNFYFKFVGFFLDYAWIWMPFALAYAFFESWMFYIQRAYWKSLEWVTLEIKPPREIERTPKTMEQVFAGLWGSFGTVGTKYEKYIKGKMQDYFSFEIVGVNGEIHFYIRTLKKFRNLVEAQVYSQYPQAEIKEAEDYVKSVPINLPNKNWDLWGTRLKLDKDEIYPIRTYPLLVDVTSGKQPNFLDPLSGLMENLGKLRLGEQIWIQILFRPTDDKWRDKAYKKINSIIGWKDEPKEPGALAKELNSWTEVISGVAKEFVTSTPYEVLSKKEEQKGPLQSSLTHIPPQQKDAALGISEKASKKAYEAKVQCVYIGRKEIWNPANISAMMGFFNQFANLNLNSLRPDGKTMTKANYAFAKVRKAFRQRKLIKMMRARTFWEKGYILNIEELATLYHFPTMAVQAPVTPYIEMKKGGPPVGLPIE